MTLAEAKRYAFIEVEGEMSELIRNYNWETTSIGTIDGWPLSLKITLGNILHSGFPMFLFWTKDLICFYNDAFRPSLGVDGKHPSIGKKGVEVWPEIWDFIFPLIQQVMTTGKPVWFEDQLVPFYRNGRVEDIYWTFSYSPAIGDDGQICGVLVTCMETTENVVARKTIEETVERRTRELKDAHENLLDANEYLQTIINLFKEPMQVLEPVFENDAIVDFRFKLTNQAYANYAQTTPALLEGKKVGEVFPGYFETFSFTKPVETFRTGKPDTFEIHYDTDGLDLYNLMSTTKLDNSVIVHFTDFTELKRLQLELLEKIKELEHSNQQLEEFAHAASHDMKEPLRKIQLYVSHLKQETKNKLSDTETEHFERVERAAIRMRMLIDDLLTYSQLHQTPLEKESIDLNELLKHVLADLELAVEQKGAIIDLNDLPLVRGYGRQLQQAFQNLVDNAIKYSKPDIPPRITIRYERIFEGSKALHLIEVADNGIGFDPGFSDRIFQMFARLHDKYHYEGSGIGLAIVKKVVDNHGGYISVESVPGEGSIFRVRLPD